MENPSALSRDDLRVLVERFVDSFNRNDLDAVMRHFANDAVYVTYDGKEHRGKRKIREALEPQFRGEYGRMEFLVEEQILDEESSRAVVTWSCRHDLEHGGEVMGLAQARNLLFRGVYGSAFVWRGLDVLVFEGGLLAEKRTYAQAHVPLGKGGR